jgi:hypothetical protein
MIYIDLNMVRAEVESHQEEWIYSGFHELHCKQPCTNIIDEKLLTSNLGFSQLKLLRNNIQIGLIRHYKKED